MKKGKFILSLSMIGLVSIFILGIAQAIQDWSWLLKGEQPLLEEVLKKCTGCDSLQTIVATKRTQDEWKAYFNQKGALKDLNPKEVNALIGYLAINMPVRKESLPGDPQKITVSVLPEDGRTLMLEKCTLCHPLGPILVVNKDATAWRSLYASPPHPELKMPAMEVETLVSYLIYATPIPKEKIPEELMGEIPGF